MLFKDFLEPIRVIAHWLLLQQLNEKLFIFRGHIVHTVALWNEEIDLEMPLQPDHPHYFIVPVVFFDTSPRLLQEEVNRLWRL